MNVISFLKDSVEKFPSKTAIIDEERTLTFNELYQEVLKFSSHLGSVDKNVVSLVAENSISFITSYLGIINSGRAAHLIPPEISHTNMLIQLRSADSGMIVCSSVTKNNLSKYPAIKIPSFEFNEVLSRPIQQRTNLKSNDLAYLLYTSGTTSEPKGVAITHTMTEFTTKNIVQVLGYVSLFWFRMLSYIITCRLYACFIKKCK